MNAPQADLPSLRPTKPKTPLSAPRVAATLTLLCLQSCALFSVDNGYAREELPSGKSYWLSYDAARRGGFVLAEKGNKGMVLSEPAPDASASTALKLMAKASDGAQKLSGELSYEYSRTVAELAGRSQNVLVLREALYRLSELYVNGAFGPVTDGTNPKVEELYTGTLASLVEFAKAARIEASTRQAQEANKQAAEAGKKAEALERQAVTVKDLFDQMRGMGLEQMNALRNSLPEDKRELMLAARDAQAEAKLKQEAEKLRAQEQQFRDAAVAALRND